MGRKLKTLVWVLCVHAAALFLFTTGFFLTRFEVPDVSQCGVLPHDDRPVATAHLRRQDESEELRDDEAHSEGCWMPRRYKRVIFVVIDALRYDFVTSTSTSAAVPAGSTAPSFYLNHLPVFSDMLARKPNNSLLLRFVADAPTMTMQRLKGLTTGSLPTFLDIKDNMASTEIAEDNLIRQMSEQKRKIVFMGDDTWDGLYAKHFTRKYSYDSFNVKDLDTVDNGVVRHLFPELRNNDWGLLIAHFLGVDHVGHTHGPSSPFMTKKLHEMNVVMEKLLAEVDDEDTLLAVMGDHGMSADGNHGGATDEEIGAALFLFSKKPLVQKGKGVAALWPDEVPQVDLVPTLALLSGLPIPFGNLGSVIPQLFLNHDGDQSGRTASFKTLNQALGLNVDQVRRYLFRYSRASKLPEREYDTLERIYSEITMLKQQLQQDSHSERDQESHLKLAHLQQEFLREALSLGRSIWTQFDFCNMGWGLVFLVWSLWLVAVAGAQGQDSGSGGDEENTDHFPLRWSVVGALTGFFFPALDPLIPVVPAAAFSRALVVAVSFGLVDSTLRARFQIHMNRINLAGVVAKMFNASTVVAFAVVLLHVLALLSNSYIVAEDKVMTFLSVTAGFFLLVQSQRIVNHPDAKVAATVSCVVLVVSTRLASALDPPNIIQSGVSLHRTYAPLVATAMLAYVTTIAATGCNPLAPSSSPLRVRCMFASVVTSCVSCGAYWSFSPIESTFVRLWLPRSVFLTALGGIAFDLQRGAMQQLRFRSSQKQETSQLLRMSPEYVLMVFQVVPAFMLVLGPTSPLSVVCLVLQCLSFAAIASLCHSSSSPKSSSVSSSSSQCRMPLSWIFLWSTICYQSFFFTGHQNTFTSLQNAAAFVGFDAFHFYWAGALLGFNTFGSYVVWLLFLPLALAQKEHLQNATSTEQLRKRQVRATVVALSRWWQACFVVVLHFALNAAVSTAFVALQRRHLMVWAIFAPKFIFDAIALLVVELLVILTSLHVLRLRS